MADLLKPETLELFLFFVVPGFIAVKVHDLIIPRSDRKLADSLIEIVSYGMINSALLFWAFTHLQAQGFKGQHPAIYNLALIFLLVVIPSILAFIATRVRSWKPLLKLILDPSPTAWDYFFNKRLGCWVLLHLKDGTMLGGIMSTTSSASTFPSPQDLYLEEVWKVNDDGIFQERIEGTLGALVKREECSHIELFKMEE